MRLKIAFDVDGTLIYQDGHLADTPRYEIIQMYKTLQAQGHDMYVWSGGGMNYAGEWTHKLGLIATVIEKEEGQDIDLAFDDIAHPWEETLAKVVVRV